MTLHPDWKKSYKWISVQAMTLATAIQGAWMILPADLKSVVSPHTVHIITMTLLIAGIAGRLVQQGFADPSSDQSKE